MDESGTDDDSPILTVGGYLFRKKRAVQFARRAKSLLLRHSVSKPSRPRYFRMTDCVHLEGEFKGFERAESIEINRSMIQLVRRHTEFGFAVLLNEDEYDARLAGRSGLPSAYAFACRIALDMVRRFITKHDYRGDVAYFFETGHAHRANANALLEGMFTSERQQALYHYAGHAFMPKEKAPPLWAGDMMAWHSYADYVRATKNERRRLDFDALLRADLDVYRYYTIEAMTNLADAITQEGIPDDPKPFRSDRAARKASRRGPAS
jgi:hypothetical protein